MKCFILLLYELNKSRVTITIFIAKKNFTEESFL